MKDSFCRFFCILLTLALTVGGICSCKKDAPEPKDDPQTEATVPTREDPPEPEDPTDYAKLSAQQFEGLAETPASEFTVTESNGRLTVTGYTGQGSKVRIPESIGSKPVTGLADGAFRGHTELTSLFIPDSVTEFGEDILVGCSNLYALHTPLPAEEGKVFLGYLYGAEIYEKNNMPDLRNLDFLELGGSLAELPAYSLYDCNDLVCVRLPQGMTSLGTFSLYRCESLKYINSEQLTHVADHAMDHCSSLVKLTFGEELQTVGLGALENCRSLRELTLPFVGGSRTGNRWLGYLFGAAEPDFSKGFYPSALRTVTLLPECRELGDYAFYECTGLRTVEFGGQLTSVGVRAFWGCTRLKEISFPDSLQTVREYAFAECVSLASVRFGGLTSLGIGAFAECTALTEVILPDTLTTLPNSCFSGCTALQTVALGGVVTVGINAFHRCDSLTAVSTDHSVTFERGNENAEQVLRKP